MKISYGITVHNEADELNKLLEILIHKTDPEDEIVICDDYSNEETKEVITSWFQQYASVKVIKHYERKLDGDFSAQKNSVIENCSGDYIFHIDADEQIGEVFLEHIKQVIEMNDVDLIYLPRINTVDGLTQRHVEMWRWNVVPNPYNMIAEKELDTESDEYKFLKKGGYIIDEEIL